METTKIIKKHNFADQDVFPDYRETFPALFDGMPNAVAFCKIIYKEDKPIDFQYIWVNKAYEKHSGIKNVTGKKMTDLIPHVWDLDTQLLDNYARVAETGNPDQFEIYFKAIDKWFTISTHSPEKGYFISIFSSITEIKKVEAQKNELLERLQKIASMVPGVVYQYRLRPDGTSCFPFASSSITELYHVTPEEVMEDASKVFSRIHPDDYNQVVESIQVSAKELTPWKDEYRVIYEDGTIRTVLGNSIPQREEDGSILWHGFITDITERKQLEELFRKSEEKLSLAFNQAQLTYWEFNMADHCFIFNDRFYELYGTTAEKEGGYIMNAEVYTKEFLLPEDQSIVSKEIARSLSGETSQLQIDHRIRRRDGIIRFINVRANPVYNNSGKVIGAFGCNQDITDRKKAELALKQSEERYKGLTNLLETIFDQAPGLLFYKDDKNNYIKVNRYIAKAHGKNRDEIEGKNLAELYPKEEANKYYEDDVTIIESGKAKLNIEETWNTDNGLAWINTSKIPFKNEAGEVIGIIGMSMDITERKKLESDLRESEQNLRQAELIGKFGHWKLDMNTQVFEFSAGAAEIYGVKGKHIPRSEIINSRLPEYNSIIDEAFRKLVEENKPYELEYKIKRKNDGKIVGIHIISDYNEKDCILFGSVQDITEQMEAREALTLSEKKFRHLIREMNIGVLLQGPNAEILLNNEKALELLGLSEEQLLGKTSFDPDWNVIHEDGSNFPGNTHPVPHAIETKKIVKDVVMGVYRPLQKDRLWLLVNAIPKFNFDGSVRQVICTFSDITENKKKEDQIKISEMNLKNAQHIGHIGNWKWNIKTSELEWSEEMYNIFGYDKESFTGSLSEFHARSIHPEDLSIVNMQIQNVIQKRILSPIENRIILPDGSIRFIAIETGELVNDEMGNPAVLTGTCQDITDRKNKELEIERLNNELKELAKYLQDVRITERNKLAIEVHDKLGQQLIALRFELDWLRVNMHEDKAVIEQRVDTLSSEVVAMIKDFKKLYYDVNPTLLSDTELLDSIEWLTNSFSDKTDIEVSFYSNIQKQEFSKELKLALYKTVEESLSNIEQYAKATRVSVSIIKQDNILTLAIEDNGCGFEPSKVDTKKHHGILQIRERVNSVSGKLDIHSVIGKGTTVEVTISL